MNRFRQFTLAGLALLAAALAPGLAEAANAFATSNVNQRAGPGTEYPVVVVIPAGAPVNIYGCLEGYDWCDVDWYGNRGWVAGYFLEAMYQSRRVALPEYAPYVGVPYVAFNFDTYWDNYYRARPFYGERYRWRGGPRPGPGPAPGPYAGPKPYYGPKPGPGPYYGPKPGPVYQETYAPTYAPTYKETYAPTYNKTYAPTYNKTYAPTVKKTYNYYEDDKGGGGGGNNNKNVNKGGGGGGNNNKGKDQPKKEASNDGGKGKGKDGKCYFANGKPRPCSMNPNLQPP